MTDSAPLQPRRTLPVVAATVTFWLAFVLTSWMVVVVGGLFWLITAPFDPARRWMHALTCFWTFQYLRIWPGWRIEIEGREKIPNAAAVLVANHQSMADIVVLMGVRRPFRFVSKASLFSLPLVGWMMRMCRYIGVERGSVRSMGGMMEACRGSLAEGVPVLIFPEGTYSSTGVMLPFRRGAFQLALDAGVPVIPIAISGTPDLVVEDGPWMHATCAVTLTVLDPLVAGARPSDPEALAAEVRQRMESHLATLVSAGGGSSGDAS